MSIKTMLPSLALFLLFSCGDSATAPSSADPAPIGFAQGPPAAASEEKMTTGLSDEWTSLFNGQDLSGWHGYGQDTIGQAWKIDDGAIYLDVTDKDGWQSNNGGDIISDASYDNYELELEWKIGKCGNSGIIYNVQETDDYSYPWMTGPEMQVLDNTCHPDAEIITHRAGDLYDMVSVKEENDNPAGEWNKVKLVVTPGRVEHWQNGVQQVVYNNEGDDWKAMIADSKFKDMKNWGMFTGGKISLQDHGDPVWFRNIRIRAVSK